MVMKTLDRTSLSDDYGVVAMVMNALMPPSSSGTGRVLTPEEDAIGEPEEAEDEVDDMLPADLWF
jgi:hypothetical protein